MDDELLSEEVSDLMAVIGLLMRRVRDAAAHDLSWSQTTVLGRLSKEGPKTSAELARAEGVKPQSMGTTLAELMDLGLVSRKPHPTDGRQMLNEITPQGTAFRLAAGDKKRTWLTQAVAQLEDQDQKTLFAATKVLERIASL